MKVHQNREWWYNRYLYNPNSMAIREALTKAYGNKCHACRKQMRTTGWDRRGPTASANHDYRTLEHVISVSTFGAHVWDNWVLLCQECNLSKGGNESMNEFLKRKGYKCACGKKCKKGKRWPKRYRAMLMEMNEWQRERQL